MRNLCRIRIIYASKQLVFRRIGIRTFHSSMPRNSNDSIDNQLTLPQFHEVCEETLEAIVDKIYDMGLDDKIESELSNGVLKLEHENGNNWVINKQTPNRQIWWSSPISGPLRFECTVESKDFENVLPGSEYYLKKWVCTRHQTTLGSLLDAEVFGSKE